MLCEDLALPPNPGGSHLDTVQRSVGSIVRVMCANRTVAVLECQPDGFWNSSIPACKTSDASGHMSHMGTILIVVWVLGGILLFALLILITIIITSRKKPERRVNGQPPTTVFQISGQEGGDNPAFSRSEERSGSASRLSAHEVLGEGRPAGDRLPSYHEAVTGGYIQSPVGSVNNGPDPPYFVRANAPPSYRTSQFQRGLRQVCVLLSSNGDVPMTTGATTLTASSPPPNALTTQATVHTSTTSSARQSQSVASTSQSQSQVSNRSTGPLLTSTPRPHGQGEVAASHRYVEDYPNCFWEEDPPPPYTPGPSNMHLYRSPTRNSQGGNSCRRSLPLPRPRPRQLDFSEVPLPPPASSSQAGWTNSASGTIPTAPYVSATNPSQMSATVPSSSSSSQPRVCPLPHSSQIHYSAPSDSSGRHVSTINVISHGHNHNLMQGPGNNQVSTIPSHNPPTAAHTQNRTTALHRHQVPLSPPPYGHNRSRSHGTNQIQTHRSGQGRQCLASATSSSTSSSSSSSSSRPLPPYPPPRHERQQSAPIARLEVEYF